MRRWLLVALLFALPAEAQRRPEQPAPSIVDRVRINSARPIDFHAATWPDTVYVGQQINYQVGVFLSEQARSRLRRNPEFLPPELRGLIAYELGLPRRAGSRSVNGTTFEAHVFQRALFPVASGDIVVPAPQLSYALPSSASYFSREESFVVRAESTHVHVMPLPRVNRPDDFTGAVGRLSASARFDRDSLRVGDPVVLTLRVSGLANIKLLPRPSLEISWASTVPSTERLRIDSSGALVRGYKEFDWILTPTRAGPAVLSPIRYSYFDPYRERYEVALSDSIELVIERGSIVASVDGEGAELLPLRDAPGGQGKRAQLANWSRAIPDEIWTGLLVVAPLPALMLLVSGSTGRRRREHSAPKPQAELAQLMEEARAEQGTREVSPQQARRVRRALQHALAKRLGVRIQQLIDHRQVARLLRRRGATRGTVSDTLRLLDELDRAGFARDAVDTDASYAAAARDLVMRVEEETLDPAQAVRGRWHRLSAVAVLSWNLLSTTVEAPPAVQDAAFVQQFEDARNAYEERQFVAAAEQFAVLSQRHPDDVGVLINWGTAAWAAGDTVSAVVAWQRAARLDPFAGDVQLRLSLLPAGAYGGIAAVPEVPPELARTFGIVAWIIGWSVLAVLFLQRRPLQRRFWMHGPVAMTAALLLLGGAGLSAYAYTTARTHDACNLYVVARPETMRTGSGLDADAVGGVATGDVVRHMASEGTWMQVQHADGRRGWLPLSRLVPMMAQAPGNDR